MCVCVCVCVCVALATMTLRAAPAVQSSDVLPSDLSRKVLAQARQQLDDEDRADNDNDGAADEGDDEVAAMRRIDVNAQADALAAMAGDDNDEGDADGRRARQGNAGATRQTKLRDGKGRPVDFSSDDEADNDDDNNNNDNNNGNETADENVTTDGADFEVRERLFVVYLLFYVVCVCKY